MSAFWPFSAWSIPQSLQKRLLKFLLKRAIGQFLASEIDLDKLDVEFGRGQVSLHDLELNLEVLNDLTADLPFIVTDGHITRINALIPWKDLGNSDCTLELDGLHMELTSIMDDPENGLSKSTQMSESHIMSSSVHFAENFLRSEISGDDDFGPTMDQIPGSGEPISPVGSSPSGLEGIQVLTRLIDKILARVKVTAKNTTIRIVHRSYHSIADGIESDFRQEYHLDLTFPFLMYEDETSTMQNEADQDSYAGGMTEDRQKRIRFSGITISLNQTSVEDPTGHSGVDLRDSRVRKPTTQPSYSYTAILASTSTKQEDNIRITVKGTSTDSDGRLHAPRLDVEILVDSLCALILPEQLVVMSEVFDLMGEGQAFLARNRQYGDDSDINFRSASSPGSHRSPSSPSETKRGSWPNHGYPAAGEYISDVDTPDPRHLRIRLGITQMSVYLITQRSHTSIDATQFYTLYFGGKNAARHAADFPTDLSMSFVTKLNTRLNTGTISMDDILGESLKVDHIRIGLSDILALVGYETGKATKSDKDSSDLLIRDATISEWRSSPRRDTETSGAQVGSYHAILVFELGANVEKVSDLYAQLSGSQPPLANLYRPLTKGPGGLPAAFPLDVKQSRTYAISLSVERPSSGTSNVDAGGGKSNVEEICIKLAPLHVYLSVPLLDRLRRIMPQKGNSQAGMPETLPDSLSSVGQSVGGIMDDLAQSTSGEFETHKRVVSIEIALLRAWLAVSQQDGTQVPEADEPVNTLWVDVIAARVETYSEVNEHTVGRRASIGSGPLSPLGGCLTDEANEVRHWTFHCHTAGLSLAKRSKGSPELVLRPFLSITKPLANKKSDAGAPPSLEITITPHICDSLLQRPSIDIHPSVTGLRFDRDTDEDPAGTYGLQSWYDLGSSNAGVKGKEHRLFNDDENALLWFKQRTIEEALIHVDCHVPLCFVNMEKEDYDGIQLLLNELTVRQADLPPTNPISGKVPEAAAPLLKFGTTRSSTSTEDSMGNSPNPTTSFAASSPQTRNPSSISIVATCDSLQATIHTVSVEDAAQASSESQNELSYVCAADGLRMFTVSGHEKKSTLYMWIDAQDVALSRAATDSEEVNALCIYRTLPKSLQPKQMLSASFSITYDEELNMKETWASINLDAFAVQSTIIQRTAQDIANFLKEPPEVVLVDMTNRFTKLHVNFSDACVEYQPLNMTAHATLVLDSVKLSCNLIPESPTVSLKILLYNAALYIIDDIATRRELGATSSSGFINTKKHYSAEGFANVASCDFFDISIRTNSGNITPNIEVDLSNNHVTIDTCADSFETLLSLCQYIAEGRDSPVEKIGPAEPTHQRDPVNIMSKSIHGDVLDSLDDNAFGPPPGALYGREGDAQSSCDLQMESIDDSFSPVSMDGGNGKGNGTLSPGSSDDYDFGVGDSPSARTPSARAGQKLSPSRKPAPIDTITVVADPAKFRIIDHFLSTATAAGDGKPADVYGKDNSLFRIRLRDLNLSWNIYDGYDWELTRQTVSHAQHKGKSHASGSDWDGGQPGRTSRKASFTAPGTSGASAALAPPFSILSPFINETSSDPTDENTALDIGNYFLPTLQQPPSQSAFDREDWRDDATSYSGTSGISRDTRSHHQSHHHHHRHRKPKLPADLVRSHSAQVMLKVYALRVSFDKFSDQAQVAYELGAEVRDLEIIDNVATSRWRKFLSYMRPEGNAAPRETSSMMIQVDLSSVRPDPERSADEELRLKVDILPLRLHIDQDALTCLLRFFSYQNPNREPPATPPEPESTFFQLCDIQPLSVKIDYKPKHVDYANLKGGNFVEMLNFFQLDAAEMNLRGVRLTGVRGWSRILEGVLGQWLPHIRNTQIPNMASGVSGVRSIVNIGSGIADLVLLPMEQYRKDGRIIRGLQKGAKSFAKAATSETIKIGTKIAVGTQGLLEQADEILGGEGEGSSYSGPSSPASHHSGGGAGDRDHLSSKYSEQPSDVKEGVELAYRSLSRNVATAARTVFAVPMEVYENSGTQGTVRAVMRAVPVAVLRPMIGATEAVSKTLMGIQNSMDPSKRMQMEDKYKG